MWIVGCNSSDELPVEITCLKKTAKHLIMVFGLLVHETADLPEANKVPHCKNVASNSLPKVLPLTIF